MKLLGEASVALPDEVLEAVSGGGEEHLSPQPIVIVTLNDSGEGGIGDDTQDPGGSEPCRIHLI